MSTGTPTYLPSADLLLVAYPATALIGCEYTIDQQTINGTIHNLKEATELSRQATAHVSWHRPSNTKRANSSWSKPVQGPSHWTRELCLSADFPGRSEAFYVTQQSGRPGGKQLAVASGWTDLGRGRKRASVLVLTDLLGPFPVREAEDVPITNVDVSRVPNGTSGG